MTAAVNGHELATTVDCRANGCTRAALARRGKYAYLCDEHTGLARRGEPVDVERGRRGPSPARSRPATGDGAPGLADLARGLVRPAARLEAAVERKRAATDDARAALDEFNTSLRELREAAARLLGLDPAAPR